MSSTKPNRPAGPAGPTTKDRDEAHSNTDAAASLPTVGISGLLLAGLLTGAGASSHREAPLIAEDPVADLTDVYAFVSPDKTDTVTLIANVNPFELPAGGPNFHKFGDDVLYQLNVDNDGDAVADLQYQFKFRTTTSNPNTFLYNTNQVTSLNDPDLNVKQVYDLAEVNTHTGASTTLGTGIPLRRRTSGPGPRRTTRRTSARRPSRRSAATSPPSPVLATTRSSSTSGASSTWVACGRSTRPTSSRCPRSRARTT